MLFRVTIASLCIGLICLVGSTAIAQSDSTAVTSPFKASAVPVHDESKDLGHMLRDPHEKFSFVSFSSGVWVPMDNNSILGPHPSLGVTAGGWRDRLLLEVNFDIRFGNTAHQYTVLYEGQLLKRDYFFGGCIGFDVGYSLAENKQGNLYALAGLAYDGFDAIEKDDDHDKALSINSLNKNIGLGIQHYGAKGGVIGVEVLYNVINYKNPGGTALDGNAVTIRLVFGKVTSYFRKQDNK